MTYGVGLKVLVSGESFLQPGRAANSKINGSEMAKTHNSILQSMNQSINQSRPAGKPHAKSIPSIQTCIVHGRLMLHHGIRVFCEIELIVTRKPLVHIH